MKRAAKLRGGGMWKNMPSAKPTIRAARVFIKKHKIGEKVQNVSPFVPGPAGAGLRLVLGVGKMIRQGQDGEFYADHSVAQAGTTLKTGEKLYPTDQGMASATTKFEGISRTHDGAKIYKIREQFYEGKKDEVLTTAKKLYGSNTQPLYSTEKTAYARLYAYAGLNTKGIFSPYGAYASPPLYSSVDTMSVSSSQNGYYALGENLNDVAGMLKVGLLPVGSAAGSMTELPPLASGDEDYYFPLQSFSFDMRITNTDAFLPCMVKVYTLKCKRNVTLTPKNAWFQDKGSTQQNDKLSQDFVTYSVNEIVTGLAGTPSTTQNVHPQATPLMSQAFKDNFEILKIHRQKLGPSDSLEYSMVKHYSKAHSAQDYNYDASLSIGARAGAIQYLIEFQGMPTPFYKTTAAGAVDYSAMAHAAFAKIRVTLNKNFTHSFPVSSASSLYLPTGSQYSPTFVASQKRKLDTYSDTAPYSSFSSNSAAATAYVIPLITQQSKTTASPLINDP